MKRHSYGNCKISGADLFVKGKVRDFLWGMSFQFLDEIEVISASSQNNTKLVANSDSVSPLTMI